MEREVLEALVDEGLSIRQIAARLGCSPTRVRHWLGRFGLRTRGTPGRRPGTPLVRVAEEDVERHCPVHGVTAHRRRSEGGYRCLRCRSAAVMGRRRRVKETLVAEAGGACAICGYDRCTRALQFHHVDPDAKEFGIGFQGVTRSLEKARAEARKCVLLCSNCHMEVEDGLAGLPLQLGQPDPMTEIPPSGGSRFGRG